MRRQLLLVTLAILALRLPFLNQAIQGDDPYYLYGAEHAQIEPLHPNHARYAFLGQVVDMRGHPHPPLDAWFLGGLLALEGDVREVPFHAAFLLFSLIAGYAALSLARRFTPRPMAATLLFLVTPAFVVNGNSLESDVPFAAFWLASLALFVTAVDRRSVPALAASSLAMAFASLAAYQAVVLVPILFLYVFLHDRKWKPAWIAALTAPFVICLWQIFERATSGALPATVLAGYMRTYDLQNFVQKCRNAVALTGHLGWLVFPVLPLVALRVTGRAWIVGLAVLTTAAAFFDPNPLFWASIGVGLWVLTWCARNFRDFLAAWALIFFGAALVIFFAGSARYLLPVALPLAILVSGRATPRVLYGGVALGGLLALSLATVNYQHWDQYRQFAASLKRQAQSRRVWMNGEWGLRFYLESDGALPLMAAQAVHPGEMVVSSSLAYPLKVIPAGGVLETVLEREITSPIPLRLVALGGRSAYSTTLFGLRPFDISTGPIDRVRAEMVIERKPQLARFTMNAPGAASQILSGIYDVENGQWRWMAGSAAVLLKAPARPSPISVRFYIPPQAPARVVTVSAGGKQLARQEFPGPGTYTLTTAPFTANAESASIAITVDKTFMTPGDPRELGVILLEIGFDREVQ